MSDFGITEESFVGLGISSPYIERLIERGLKAPVPVQNNAIPVIDAGHDVIVHSATGTGKTLAYLLPLLQKLDSNCEGITISDYRPYPRISDADCTGNRMVSRSRSCSRLNWRGCSDETDR